MKKREWSLRAYREGDEEELYNLYQAVYPSKEHDYDEWFRSWHWMYQEAPHGSNIWLAEDKGKIVGQYCVRIVDLKLGDDIIKATHSLDTATHPNYQGQGIMSTLSRKTFDELAKNGNHVIYGFPNERAYPVDMKLGFLDIAPMRSMIKIFKWENTLRTRISNKFLLKCCALTGKVFEVLILRNYKVPDVKNLTVTQVSNFDERINEFCARVLKLYPIVIVRSEHYLNWRYTTIPNQSYSIYLAEKGEGICGYLVLRCGLEENKGTAVVCELFSDSEEIAQHLLLKAIEHGKKGGMDYIIWSGIANTAYLKAFRKMGFIRQPFRKNITEFVVYLSGSHISKEFIVNPQNWLVQEGDSDTI